MKVCRQRNSGIGGQAVLEGVMMRNKEKYAIAVRKSDGSIVLKKDTYTGLFGDSMLKKIPFLRGVFVFIDSMVLGLSCTNYSAEIYAEDEEEEAAEGTEAVKTASDMMSAVKEEGSAAGTETESFSSGMVSAVKEEGSAAGTETESFSSGMVSAAKEEDSAAGTEAESFSSGMVSAAKEEGSAAGAEAEGSSSVVSAGAKEEKAGSSALEKVFSVAVTVISFVLAVGLFMVLPFFLASRLAGLIGSTAIISLLEGLIRIAIFVSYILLISQMKDIRRLFQYHGAEHKCINCLETGKELTVENVKSSSRFHKRCGSSFILFVMLVSIVLFFFIRVGNPLMRVGLRILLLPVISGISYELIRFAGSSDNPLIGVLSKPGLWLQGLTTKEPDEEMIGVAIASVEAVFDWHTYLAENPL